MQSRRLNEGALSGYLQPIPKALLVAEVGVGERQQTAGGSNMTFLSVICQCGFGSGGAVGISQFILLGYKAFAIEEGGKADIPQRIIRADQEPLLAGQLLCCRSEEKTVESLCRFAKGSARIGAGFLEELRLLCQLGCLALERIGLDLDAFALPGQHKQRHLVYRYIARVPITCAGYRERHILQECSDIAWL